MNDGQNLFGAGSTFGSWKVDATVDQLTSTNQIDEVIVVGIDNTNNRANEYNLGGTGIVEQYGKFVAEEVAPFINNEYRTLIGPEHTTIMGSSYGGNAALYVGWQHSDVFGNLGIFSSTLIWNNFELFKKIQREMNQSKKSLKFSIYVGDREKLDEDGNGLANYAEWTIDLAKYLHSNGWTVGKNLIYMIGENSIHNEASWANHVDQPIRFFYSKNKDALPISMYVKASASELDTAGTISNVWVFPYVQYSNAVRTIYPNAILDSNSLLIVERNFDQISLKNRLNTALQPLNLQYSFENLRASANVKVVSFPSSKVKVTVEVLAPLSPVQKIYMTGDFSSWGQNINADYVLQRVADLNGKARYLATIVMDKYKTITFKFRAGSDWSFVEKKMDGTDSLNRELKTADRDVYAPYTIERWNATPNQ
jgi:predicted alpha/beta superfamily hydrolase